MDPLASQEVSRLEGLGADRAGAPSFPALAEAHRRAGRPEEARKLAEAGLAEAPARLAGRVALALALIDLDETEAAKAQLELVLDTEPAHPLALQALAPIGESIAEPIADPLAALDEDELEDAFAEAESEPDEMFTANHVAEAALRAVEDGGPEGVQLDADSPFATETVATLLEEQGDSDAAQAIRNTLSRQVPDAPTGFNRDRVIATLERWLDNLRRSTR